jgi:nucleoid DNA-binding protein
MPAKKKAAKAAPKKAPAKKAAAKKAPAKKAAAKRSDGCPEGRRRVNVKMPTGGRRAVCAITSSSGLAKVVAAKVGDPKLKPAQARKVFMAFSEVVAAEAKSGLPTPIPGVGKVRIVRRKARAAKTIDNPFDGGKTKLKVKARPAMNVVKIRAAKAVKKAAAKSS